MSNPTIAPTLINPFFGQNVPLDGGAQSQIAVLTGILFELRVQSELLYQIASGANKPDDLLKLRQDQYVYLDPNFLEIA